MRNFHTVIGYPMNIAADILESKNMQEINVQGVNYALSCLDSRQQEILYRHYKQNKTLVTIGEELNYTPDYIYRLKSAAMSKLRDRKLLRYMTCEKSVPKKDSIHYIYDRHIIDLNFLSDKTYKLLLENKLTTPRKILQHKDIYGDNWKVRLKGAKPKAIKEIEEIINPILKQLGKL